MIGGLFITFGVISIMRWADAISPQAYGVIALMLAGLMVIELIKEDNRENDRWMQERRIQRERKERKEYEEWTKKLNG